MARKDPVSHLSRHPVDLPPRLVAEVLALGRPGLEQLVAIVGDRERWDTDPVGVANAAWVLGRSGDPIGISGLVRLFAEADGIVYVKTRGGLSRLVGPELVEPLLALDLDGERRADATEILAWCGTIDPRITARVAELVRSEPARGVMAARTYGVRELVPVLQAAFDGIDRTRIATVEEGDLACEIVAALDVLGTADELRVKAARDLLLLANADLRDQLVEIEEQLERERRRALAWEAEIRARLDE